MPALQDNLPGLTITPPSPIIPDTNAFNTINLSPIIQLPGHDPLTTTLTPDQLATLFPTLHIYILPSQPTIALLPAGSTTHRGLSTALSVTEENLTHPGRAFHLAVDELLETYQTLAYLGNAPNTPVMQVLSQHIIALFDDGLTLVELDAVWALRDYAFTQYLLAQLIARLGVFCQVVMEWFEDPVFLASYQDMHEQERRVVDGQYEIVKWISRDPEMRSRVSEAHDKSRREEEEKVKAQRRRRMYGQRKTEEERRKVYGYRKGKRWLAKSAVKCFEGTLDVVDEEVPGL